ncbi:MAG TPA: enoyl-CoA hydratase-related protein [Acidimicrobiales bacterium]|nr:enoyl-CoA hydratase-related protein [Acidimicrobiales bacterium]
MDTGQGTDIVSERRGNVLVLRINRPEARNALNQAVVAGIGSGLAEAEADPSVRAVVVTGTGDRAFCAGMDLREFAAGRQKPDDPAVAEQRRKGAEGYRRFIREGVDVPVVAAANGPAVAGGFELLLACDLAVAAEHATFGLPEVCRGLFPAGGGVFLTRRIPSAVALELGLTGEVVDAHRAAALGLVNRVVPADRVLDEAVALAERIAANGPLGVQATKRLMLAARSAPADEVWRLQEELQPKVFGSEDAREGALAFTERRAPVWKGR